MSRHSLFATLVLAAFAASCAGSVADHGAEASATPTETSTPTPLPTPNLCTATGSTTPTGGTLDCLSFAIIGDTRPATVDDTAGYPTPIIKKIYQDIQGLAARPSFGVSTGDYVYANKTGTAGSAQMDLYLAAQANYTGAVYHAMGNHECTGYTSSNCGSGNADGITTPYTAFLTKMLPAGVGKPYYVVKFTATDASWTAKFVFVAPNAWSSAQATWLGTELAKPTTYTFVVRHEGLNATTAPGMTPSQNIIVQHPYTMLLEGHTHTFSYYANDKEVITGIGGAPLTGSMNYGYVVVRQREDGAIDFAAYDYSSGAVMKHFIVTKDGSPTN